MNGLGAVGLGGSGRRNFGALLDCVLDRLAAELGPTNCPSADTLVDKLVLSSVKLRRLAGRPVANPNRYAVFLDSELFGDAPAVTVARHCLAEQLGAPASVLDRLSSGPAMVGKTLCLSQEWAVSGGAVKATGRFYFQSTHDDTDPIQSWLKCKLLKKSRRKLSWLLSKLLLKKTSNNFSSTSRKAFLLRRSSHCA
jgi:hypothetical protein